MARLTMKQRFYAKVALPAGELGCMEWTAGRSDAGYGFFAVRQPAKRNYQAHRLAYEFAHGPIPEGLVLDHLCRNRGCCRVDHLEPVSIGENVMRGDTLSAANAAKTHCSNGHSLNAENTHVVKQGWRRCRRCNADSVRRSTAKKRSA